MVLPYLTEEDRNRNYLIHLSLNSFGTIPFIDEALVTAVEEGCMDVMKGLLCNGANANSRDKSNTTVMNKAIKYGRSSILRLLCQHNVDVRIWSHATNISCRIWSRGNNKYSVGKWSKCKY
jgi:ankyrin repeat protein